MAASPLPGTASPSRLGGVTLTLNLGEDRRLMDETASREGIAGFVLLPPTDLPLTELGSLRGCIRAAHDHKLPAIVTVPWVMLHAALQGNGRLDSADPVAGKRARQLARELHQRLPESDGMILQAEPSRPESGSPSTAFSDAFLKEFFARSNFSGEAYHLDDHLASLATWNEDAPRVRSDYASVCEDLAFRLLSNLTTELQRCFGRGFRLGLSWHLPRLLVPQPFGWLHDPFRFSLLGETVFSAGDSNLHWTAALGRALTRYARSGAWRTTDGDLESIGPRPASIALIINPRAPLTEPADALAQYLQHLEDVSRTLTEAGFPHDAITPGLMTTSTMTDNGGFCRDQQEYAGAVYPWPTMHTPYEWRELCGFLEEKGKAFFLGPRPAHLSDGTAIRPGERSLFEAHRLVEVSHIPEALATPVATTPAEAEPTGAPPEAAPVQS